MARFFNVSEPWFSLIALGLKVVEGRKNKPPFADLRPGDIVVWTNNDLPVARSCRTVVKSLRTFPSFEKYLRSETLARTLPAPGIKTIADGVSVYRQFYSREDEKRWGVLAITLQLI